MRLHDPEAYEGHRGRDIVFLHSMAVLFGSTYLEMEACNWTINSESKKKGLRNMSGIFERMSADIAALNSKVDQLLKAAVAGGNAPAPAIPTTVAPVEPVAVAAAAVDPLALTPAAAAPAVTQEAIVALISPHLGDPAIKSALQAAMHGMGIQALPEAQPAQYGELYAKFSAAINGAATAAAPAAPASII